MKTTIAVIFGGRSVEHEVSIVSALQAISNIDKEKYDVIPLYISKSGNFYTGDVLFNVENFRDIPSVIKKSQQVAPYGDNGMLKLIPISKFSKKILSADVIFPIVHGTNCEDGTLQGLIELYNIPYVGCNVMSSAAGMDKYVSKLILKSSGIPVVDAKQYYNFEWNNNKDAVCDELESFAAYPIIVKPVNLGSSVGIRKVHNRDELFDAIEFAFNFSDRVIVERAVQNLREINCSVYGSASQNQASVCEEPISADEILSYADKYTSSSSSKGMSGSKRRIPAELPEETSEYIRSLAKKTFTALDCSGVARIDFLMDSVSGEIFVNEINAIPGSLAFYLWEPLGISYPHLLDELIKGAFKRAQDRRSLTYSYNDNILALGGGGFKGGIKGVKR